ncbi:hypothetical protein BCR34DRAFT_178226 [Clohesyomyces aquaticus]|uniref:Uncharacterized protein n=1 Tax=Clohesyomyces aquaticus TaxID=1231657 RepID=A0A1Y1ZZ11_9PLEO|nr:hypothetical protein BCR34DRAFT_178226 [Clohesyomyces aquaticus]
MNLLNLYLNSVDRLSSYSHHDSCRPCPTKALSYSAFMSLFGLALHPSFPLTHLKQQAEPPDEYHTINSGCFNIDTDSVDRPDDHSVPKPHTIVRVARKMEVSIETNTSITERDAISPFPNPRALPSWPLGTIPLTLVCMFIIISLCSLYLSLQKRSWNRNPASVPRGQRRATFREYSRLGSANR